MASVLERLMRVELQVVVVALPDATRRAARDRARAAAIVAGRLGLFDEATEAARESAIKAFAGGGFSGTWAATEMAMSVASARDRVGAVSAFEETAMAAVVEDLVDAETLDVLRSTIGRLDTMRGVPPPGSLAALGASTVAARGPFQSRVAAGIAVLLVAIGLAVGGGQGILMVVLALAIVTSLVWRRQRPGR